MITLTDIQIQLAEELLKSVHDKEEFLYYSDLAKRVKPPMNPRNVGYNIGQVSLLCHELGLPLLSAKVINKSTNKNGQGFFSLYAEMGIPTEGKSAADLQHAQLEAIRSCKEWYKLEEYLGLHVGMQQTEGDLPPIPAGYLDARRPVSYARSMDILNICFGQHILGKTYSGWMRGALDFKCGGANYTVWFPKLSTTGTSATSSGWINRISSNGMVIEEYGGTPYKDFDNERLVFAKAGSKPYLFRGVFVEDKTRSSASHHYFEKVADIADFSGDAPIIHYFADEAERDDNLIAHINGSDFFIESEGFQYAGKPLPVPEAKLSANRKIYPRNPQTAKNALSHARYQCELDPEHRTFIRRNSEVPYTEPHHLVPMSMQDRFQVSLDVEENIVSLCSVCHNQIHYGKGAEKLIAALYALRKDALQSVGINISLNELLSFYNLDPGA